ncbi:MAG: Gfo/Idh/MocA family oxidoreductase [Actinomycetota bacterium]
MGCGPWGLNHVRVWKDLGLLGAVCETDAARLAAVRSACRDIIATQDLREILAAPSIQGVVIATPAPTHAALALAALEAGKDVLVEKPLALTLGDGRLLADTAARLGRILMVGHVLEYHPAARELHRLVREGELGELRYVSSNRLNLGRIRSEESSLWSFAPHDIALILRLVGEMPQAVSCHGAAYLRQGVADVTLTALQFANGVLGHLFVSWLQPQKEQRTVVVGGRQMVVFDDTRPWEEKLMRYPHRVEIVGNAGVVRRAEGVPVALERIEPLRSECEEFIGCIQTRRRPLSDAESGVRVLRVLEAAEASLEAGGAVRPMDAPFLEPAEAGAFVHPTAVVDPGAEIGEETQIWHFGHVMPGALIGTGCVLGQNVFVASGVLIGDGVRIQNNVSVYEGVELEDDVFVGPSATFTNVLRPRAAIDRRDQFLKTIVRRGATLAANCTVVAGVEIGRYAFVAAGAVVTRNVPDHALVAGVPARMVGWVCECGGPVRVDQPPVACAACSRPYRVIPGGGIEPA